LIVGGNDTTRNSMTGGLLFLSQNPDELKKLRAKPELIDSMAPEIIRYQTPLAYMRRTALADVEFGGQLIRKGDKVAMWYISGNRDEEAIEDPRPLHHRPPPPTPAPLVRLRHPPLRRQEPGRNATQDPVGGNPRPPAGNRGRRRAEARVLGLCARHQRTHGAHPCVGAPRLDGIRRTWTAPVGKRFFDVVSGVVGCGHTSGLLARRAWPLAS
jgi:cytochrome P450